MALIPDKQKSQYNVTMLCDVCLCSQMFHCIHDSKFHNPDHKLHNTFVCVFLYHKVDTCPVDLVVDSMYCAIREIWIQHTLYLGLYRGQFAPTFAQVVYPLSVYEYIFCHLFVGIYDMSILWTVSYHKIYTVEYSVACPMPNIYEWNETCAYATVTNKIQPITYANISLSASEHTPTEPSQCMFKICSYLTHDTFLWNTWSMYGWPHRMHTDYSLFVLAFRTRNPEKTCDSSLQSCINIKLPLTLTLTQNGHNNFTPLFAQNTDHQWPIHRSLLTHRHYKIISTRVWGYTIN